MKFLISDAWAQAGGGGGSSMLSFLPLALIFCTVLFSFDPPPTEKEKRTQGHGGGNEGWRRGRHQRRSAG